MQKYVFLFIFLVFVWMFTKNAYLCNALER